MDDDLSPRSSPKPSSSREEFEGNYRLNEKTITGGVNIEHLLIQDDSVDLWTDASPVTRSGTNMFINLTDPMLPQSSLELEIQWSFTMPKGVANRYGKYGDHAYFVAYWYPQMAVYDDVFGWDVFDHTGQHDAQANAT